MWDFWGSLLVSTILLIIILRQIRDGKHYKPPTNQNDPLTWVTKKTLSSHPSSGVPAGLLWPSSASRGSWSEQFWLDFFPRAGKGASHSNTWHENFSSFGSKVAFLQLCMDFVSWNLQYLLCLMYISLKNWLSVLVHLTCYRICARGLSATIHYHNKSVTIQCVQMLFHSL